MQEKLEKKNIFSITKVNTTIDIKSIAIHFLTKPCQDQCIKKVWKQQTQHAVVIDDK